jgi:CDP-glycerol glycerophosphotransferase (TagB/SpsB family)
MIFDFKASDIMISDTSSILYEYLVTGKPIIVVKNEYDRLHIMPDEMNIMKYVYFYDNTQDICALTQNALAEHGYKEVYEKMLHHCFYFNDGKSVTRAKEFVRGLM